MITLIRRLASGALVTLLVAGSASLAGCAADTDESDDDFGAEADDEEVAASEDAIVTDCPDNASSRPYKDYFATHVTSVNRIGCSTAAKVFARKHRPGAAIKYKIGTAWSCTAIVPGSSPPVALSPIEFRSTQGVLGTFQEHRCVSGARAFRVHVGAD